MSGQMRTRKKSMGEMLIGTKTKLQFDEIPDPGIILCVASIDYKHLALLDSKMLSIIDQIFFYEDKKHWKMHDRLRYFADILQIIEENYDKIQLRVKRGE